jgi:hypothetical protein
MHLLQIEDNAGDVMLVREALKTVETKVEHNVVEDGQAALDFLERGAPVYWPDAPVKEVNL